MAVGAFDERYILLRAAVLEGPVVDAVHVHLNKQTCSYELQYILKCTKYLRPDSQALVDVYINNQISIY